MEFLAPILKQLADAGRNLSAKGNSIISERYLPNVMPRITMSLSLGNDSIVMEINNKGAAVTAVRTRLTVLADRVPQPEEVGFRIQSVREMFLGEGRDDPAFHVQRQ